MHVRKGHRKHISLGYSILKVLIYIDRYDLTFNFEHIRDNKIKKINNDYKTTVKV